MKKFMCIIKVPQPRNFLNIQFGNIDFFVFLQNQNKSVSTRGVSTKESRLYFLCFQTFFLYFFKNYSRWDLKVYILKFKSWKIKSLSRATKKSIFYIIYNICLISEFNVFLKWNFSHFQWLFSVLFDLRNFN